MPHRKPDKDLRLGLWKIRILHLASVEPVWGGKLTKLTAAWGDHVPLSVVHDALAFMAMKGWIVRVEDPAEPMVRAFAISPTGRQRLDQLRQQIGDLHAAIHVGDKSGTPQVAHLVRRTLEDRDRMRAALTGMLDVVKTALGKGRAAKPTRRAAGTRPSRTKSAVDAVGPPTEVGMRAHSGDSLPG